jgi:tetratricopeptide (TPR) repeat protein
MTGSLCAEDALQNVVAVAQADSSRGVELIDQLLTDYPDDPRLHFVRGSLLVELKRHIEAYSAMSRAVEIAPGFEIARFQLGLFELTSGEADRAISTWVPLKELPPQHYLNLFVRGLEHLIADRFEQCIAALRAGIASNAENQPLNRDMELIIDRCDEIIASTSRSTPDEGDAVSATSLLLRK